MNKITQTVTVYFEYQFGFLVKYEHNFLEIQIPFFEILIKLK